MRFDDGGKFSLILMSLIIMVDHGSKLLVVFGDTIVLGEFLTVADDFKRFHVEVVLEREVDIYFAGPY